MVKLKGAYMGKIHRIDLSTREYAIKSIRELEIMKLLGGRGWQPKYTMMR